MPLTKSKNKNMRQLVASLLVDAEVPEGQTIYVVKTPRADAKHTGDEKCICYRCQPARNGGLSMYGVQFTDGVAIVTDQVASEQIIRVKVSDKEIEERPMVAKELADKIVAEFPEYRYEELA